MSTPSGQQTPGISIPGICQHLPITLALSERAALNTTQAGTENAATLILGRTLDGGEIRLHATDAGAAEYFADLSRRAALLASWARGSAAA